MARISNTPSVRVFTETWTADFKEAVKKAAGTDGRLTMSEAKKLAAVPGADKMFADNAVNYLKDVDPNDPDSVAQGQRFAALKRTVDSQLTDVKVFRFGEVNISTFIVGRTKTGELAALLTGQVET